MYVTTLIRFLIFLDLYLRTVYIHWGIMKLTFTENNLKELEVSSTNVSKGKLQNYVHIIRVVSGVCQCIFLYLL